MVDFRQNPSGRLKKVEHQLKNALLRANIADFKVRLNEPSIMAVEPPKGALAPADASTGLHPFLKGTVGAHVVNDLALLSGNPQDDRKSLQSEYTIQLLEQWGYSSDSVLALPQMKRYKLAKRLLKHLKEMDSARDDAMQAQFDEPVEQPHWAEDIAETGRRLQLPFKLERPQGSSLHHMAEFMKQRRDDSPIHKDVVSGVWQSFVVEHDWAAAFKGSQDFEHGEFPLPYDRTCFEFRVNGLRVLMMIGKDDDENPLGMLIIGLNGRWYMNADNFEFVNGRIASVKLNEIVEPWRGHAEAFLSRLGEQIRAVCIMLDAQVAERELIRASERLNEQRVRKGKTPLRDYHVVSLSRRHRARPMEDHVVTPSSKRRLHFRRGHWRHYDDHRTWINWMLVGDPDLGFVDKHYKL